VLASAFGSLDFSIPVQTLGVTAPATQTPKLRPFVIPHAIFCHSNFKSSFPNAKGTEPKFDAFLALPLPRGIRQLVQSLSDTAYPPLLAFHIRKPGAKPRRATATSRSFQKPSLFNTKLNRRSISPVKNSPVNRHNAAQ
jgi:hypothetical protein